MDLSTEYMGLKLRGPLMAGASPLTREIGDIEKLAAAGAGAIVLYSIFEEQLAQEAAALEYYTSKGSSIFFASGTYFAKPLEELKLGPEEYLEHIARATRAVDVPIIGSLNGLTRGGWIDFARGIEQAGAAAIELNPYQVAADPNLSAADVEKAHLEVLRAVKEAVSIPVAVKLSPFFSSLANFARSLVEAGADALVLFNRFYQPDLDVENLEVIPSLTLSSSEELRLPLRWVALLHGRMRVSLAGSTGVHTGADAAKMILAGADAVQMVSALLRNGIEHLARVRDEMVALLEAREYASVAEARGALSQRRCPDPAAFERANYMKALQVELPSSIGTTSPGPPMPS